MDRRSVNPVVCSGISRPTPRRVPLPMSVKQLRTEFNADGSWTIWLSANGDFTVGTYLCLNKDGAIKLIHLHPDGTEDVLWE